MSDTRGPHQRARPVPAAFAAGGERSVAFARARRHRVLVRALRIALPAAAALLLCSYGLFVEHSTKIGRGTVTVGPVALSTTNLTMQNPRYEGFNKDGSKYFLGARSAVQDLKQQAQIELHDIQGRLVQPNNAVTTLKAARGIFDSKTNQLELMEAIEITSGDGLAGRLSRATVFVKESKVISNEPVVLEMAAGHVHGNEMVLLQKSREVIFANGVAARLNPRPKAETTGGAQGQRRLTVASDAPVEVTAAALKVSDGLKMAVFSGRVRAQQGESALTTEELAIHYDGMPATVLATPQNESAGGVQRLVARREVVMTRGGDRVASDEAEFDATSDRATLSGRVVMTSGADRQATSDRVALDGKADTALLTGNVVVTQGQNLLRGRRLFLDRKAGTAQLSASAEGEMRPGRIAARFYQAKAESRGPLPARGSAAGEIGSSTFRADPNAPIDIQADTLEVNDTTRTAVFRGDVHAVQGDVTLRTVELVASYTGQAGLRFGEARPDPSPRHAAAQLRRIQARKKVVVTSKDDQSASGDWAEFDVETNTVTLGGDVVLTQLRNVIRGPKLVIDMTTGQSRMETARPALVQVPAGGPAKGAGSASEPPPQLAAQPPAKAAGAPPAGACGGRMCAVFYPKDAKEAVKRGLGGLARGAGRQTEEQREGPQGRTNSPAAGAASSWRPTTTQGIAN